MSLADNLGVPVHVIYSRPGKPCVVSFGREQQGIRCEFIIAAAAEAGSSQASMSPQWNATQIRQPPVRNGESMTLGADATGIGWGSDGGMSPARTTRTRDEEPQQEEDLYGEQMQVDEEEEEVPPTQQERYQGIFDF